MEINVTDSEKKKRWKKRTGLVCVLQLLFLEAYI